MPLYMLESLYRKELQYKFDDGIDSSKDLLNQLNILSIKNAKENKYF